ncbi:MAG: DUF465 domain-containing protein [Rhodospirillales bacterium]|nr:DUF465 domain-containing protein [Rhodospirillales bacterium]
MTMARAVMSSQSSRLEALQSKHAALALRIEEEQKHPFMNDTRLRDLKLKKLKVKEAIEEARQAS